MYFTNFRSLFQIASRNHCFSNETRSFSMASICFVVNRTSPFLPRASLFSCSLYQSAPYTKLLSRRPSTYPLDVILTLVLFAASLFTAALNPHRIIFGNYLRYSNSKRALPLNGRKKSARRAARPRFSKIPPNAPFRT